MMYIISTTNRFKAINFIQGPICICNNFHHDFLFQLLVLGCLGHSFGYVWRKSEMDYYIIESMPLLARNTDTQVSTGL